MNSNDEQFSGAWQAKSIEFSIHNPLLPKLLQLSQLPQLSQPINHQNATSQPTQNLNRLVPSGYEKDKAHIEAESLGKFLERHIEAM